jgi:hypothetical protein
VNPENPIRGPFLALWTEASSGNLGAYNKRLWMELEGHLDALLSSEAVRTGPEESAGIRERALELLTAVALRMEGAPADTPAMRANWVAVQNALRANLT